MRDRAPESPVLSRIDALQANAARQPPMADLTGGCSSDDLRAKWLFLDGHYLDREYAFNLEDIDAIRAEEGYGPFSQNRIIVERGGRPEVLETPLKYSPLFRAINLLGKRVKNVSGPRMPE